VDGAEDESVMGPRKDRDDRHTSVRQGVLFGILWAIGTITCNLLITDNPVWVVVLVWSLMAVPVAVLWWWLMNRAFSADRRGSRRP
jgi:hypothetical protein